MPLTHQGRSHPFITNPKESRMSSLRKSTTLMLLVIALFAAGCKQAEEGSPATETVATTAPDAGPQLMPTTDSAIAPDDLNLEFRLVEGPSYNKAEDKVSFVLEAENKGKTALSSTGKFPVNLGLTIVGPDGTAKTAPGNLEFQRVPLEHALQPGEKTEFPVVFVAAPTIGGSVVLDGVQEGVSWFHDYGKPTLTLGKFSRCNGKQDTLCGDDGVTIASEE